MSVGNKSSSTQTLRLMIYRRALHPELFDLKERTLFRHGDYEVEAWISPVGHVVRFQIGSDCLTETVLEGGNHLPETGLVHAVPCIGEKDFEMDTQDSRLGYVTTIQLESLTDNLYHTTLRELLEARPEADGLSHQWVDQAGVQCLSLLDVQKYKREFHLQSYHLLGSTWLVLRTQSIFEQLPE